MLSRFKIKMSAHRLIDEQLYAQVATELSTDDIKIGLWTKATAEANGNESRIKSLYIKYRVQAIKDETKLSDALIDETRKKELEDKERQEQLEAKKEREKLKTKEIQEELEAKREREALEGKERKLEPASNEDDFGVTSYILLMILLLVIFYFAYG